MKNKMRVVWLCSWNPEEFINEKWFVNNNKTRIISPWLDLGIETIKKRDDIELHIIGIYSKLKKNHYIYNEGIHYHLISNNISFINKAVPYRIHYIINFKIIRRKVIKKINKIEPDIVDCHGTDQLFSTVISSVNYPKIITMSCFVNDLYKFFPTKYNAMRLNVENKIFKENSNFGIRARFMESLISKYNPDANYYWYNYKIKKPEQKVLTKDKIYDLAYFARINKNKGIEDFIELIDSLHKKNRSIRAIVIGSGPTEYYHKIKSIVTSKKLGSVVTFTGYVATQQDAFNCLMQARLFVMPTYFDMIPGTLIEAMFLELPSISYDVGGISDLNEKITSLVLVEKGNVSKLTSEVESLLADSKQQKMLGRNGKKTVSEKYYSTDPINKLIKSYIDVINNGKDYLNNLGKIKD